VVFYKEMAVIALSPECVIFYKEIIVIAPSPENTTHSGDAEQ
jgi:hypothetical protein